MEPDPLRQLLLVFGYGGSPSFVYGIRMSNKQELLKEEKSRLDAHKWAEGFAAANLLPLIIESPPITKIKLQEIEQHFDRFRDQMQLVVQNNDRKDAKATINELIVKLRKIVDRL